jgi:membrane-bound metal-dependent hydrolase YbcI (DUF457 family)
MFIGHFAVALGAKRIAPEVSLGTLFLAAQLADVLWPTFVLLGWEHFKIRPGATAVTPLEFVSYPYSHSLLAMTGWSVMTGALYWAIRRKLIGAMTVAVVVLSHWLLDAVTHAPDMPLALGPYRVGLGLWNSILWTTIVEGLLFASGVAVYVLTTRARDRVGGIGLWTLVGFLIVIYCANLLVPPPPSVPAVAWSAQALWLLVAWGDWVDRHRVAHGHFTERR